MKYNNISFLFSLFPAPQRKSRQLRWKIFGTTYHRYQRKISKMKKIWEKKERKKCFEQKKMITIKKKYKEISVGLSFILISNNAYISSNEFLVHVLSYFSSCLSFRYFYDYPSIKSVGILFQSYPGIECTIHKSAGEWVFFVQEKKN